MTNTMSIVSRRNATLLFLMGLFSLTQIRVVGKLGISEMFAIIATPFVFAKCFNELRQDRLMYYWVLIGLWIITACISDYVAGSNLVLVMRGVAVPITVFANSICIYALLRKDYSNLRWLLLGMACSGVLSVFIFQRGTAGDLAMEAGLGAGIEKATNYKLFWAGQLVTWISLPIMGWYWKVPKIWRFVALVFLCCCNLVSGGRSAFLVMLISLAIIMVSGGSIKAMYKIRRHILLLLGAIIVIGYSGKVVYRYAVVNGYMGEKEIEKYEVQTETGSGFMDFLFAGRPEFFISCKAALDKPFIGHGTAALDEYGYTADFFAAHRSIEAVERIIRIRNMYGMFTIPVHSHIATYWLWHGFGALLFWLVVIILVAKTLLFRMHFFPEWFGYFAVTIPAFFWDVFFSPFGLRVAGCTLFVACLLVSKHKRMVTVA